MLTQDRAVTEMSTDGNGNITLLLDAVAHGEAGARERLWQLTYQELHQLARALMSQECGFRTIQTTALVNEAFLRLGGNEDIGFSHRGHFFTAAAVAMRRILVEGARRRGRDKRGGNFSRCELRDDTPAPLDGSVDILELNEALDALEVQDPHLWKLVHLKYFAGFTGDEAAEHLGISPRKADKDWRLAKAWLHRFMTRE